MPEATSPRSPAGRVVLFIAHETSAATLGAFGHLAQTCGADRTAIFLLDVAHGAVPPREFGPQVHTFDSRRFAEWGLPATAATMRPGHCHFPYIDFLRRHPAITEAWTVEYDVRFTGVWQRLFAAYADDDADLLTCHLRAWPAEPDWTWWRSLAVPPDVTLAARWRAFLVIARYSRAAVDAIAAAHLAGWSGHQEVLVPTAVVSAGLRVRDLDGTGINVPSRPAPRVYTSYSDLDGSLIEGGSVRYRPPRAAAGTRPDFLYHPVKPGAEGATRGTWSAFAAKAAFLRRQVAYRWLKSAYARRATAPAPASAPVRTLGQV
jgi:hypothetical protein